MCYFTNDKVSFYNYLELFKPNFKFVLNEIFSFVSKFNKYNFLHGNLHIHNIFVNPDTFLNKGRFYAIDFSNSYIYKQNVNCQEYKRISFIGEYDNKDALFLTYWDYFTLYISLKMYFKNNTQTLMYLENLILTYINPEMLYHFVKLYEKNNVIQM